ncbi:hypothetical protein JHK85_051143 [Glycine max]|nr:hypothetical protein JHK85_051143 [Glycine max]
MEVTKLCTATSFKCYAQLGRGEEGILNVKSYSVIKKSGFGLVLFECCFAWMLWKLERIDGDPVLRETRIWATWEYVSSVGGGQQGMASSWQSTDKRNKDHKARRLVVAGQLSEQYPKEYYPNDQTLPRRVSSSSSSSTTSVHVTALDGLVNVNSLFTIAVFVGLSLTTPGQRSLENRSSCDADVDVAKKLLVFEVVSFSFFLFSSLVAQGLKLALNLLNSKDADEAFRAHINLRALRLGMLGSAIGSVMGCLFLVLSMVNVIEIRLGMLSCGSKAAAHAVAAMVVLVSSALLRWHEKILDYALIGGYGFLVEATRGEFDNCK